MKSKKMFFLFLSMLFIVGCARLQWGSMTVADGRYRKHMVETGGVDEMIHNSILDFSHTRLYRRDSVFSVSFNDSVFGESTDILLDDRKTVVVKRGPLIDGVASVGILAIQGSRFLFRANVAIEDQIRGMPSRHLIKDGKLFYWYDDDYPLTQEMFDVLQKYDLLQDDEGGLIVMPELQGDDLQKGVEYYFCKEELSNYKRVITNIGIGGYEPPQMRCKSVK